GRGGYANLEPALSRIYGEDQDWFSARNRQGAARPAGAQERQGVVVRRAQDAGYGAILARQGIVDRQGSSGRKNHGRAEDDLRELITFAKSICDRGRDSFPAFSFSCWRGRY